MNILELQVLAKKYNLSVEELKELTQEIKPTLNKRNTTILQDIETVQMLYGKDIDVNNNSELLEYFYFLIYVLKDELAIDDIRLERFKVDIKENVEYNINLVVKVIKDLATKLKQRKQYKNTKDNKSANSESVNTISDDDIGDFD